MRYRYFHKLLISLPPNYDIFDEHHRSKTHVLVESWHWHVEFSSYYTYHLGVNEVAYVNVVNNHFDVVPTSILVALTVIQKIIKKAHKNIKIWSVQDMAKKVLFISSITSPTPDHSSGAWWCRIATLLPTSQSIYLIFSIPNFYSFDCEYINVKIISAFLAYIRKSDCYIPWLGDVANPGEGWVL